MREKGEEREERKEDKGQGRRQRGGKDREIKEMRGRTWERREKEVNKRREEQEREEKKIGYEVVISNPPHRQNSYKHTNSGVAASFVSR